MMAAGQPVPSSSQNPGGGADGLLNHGQVNARPVEHGILGAEVVRHVDDEHHGLCGVNGDRFRRRLDRDHPTVGVMHAIVCHRWDPPAHGLR
jgi:hypothetical protein